MSYREYRAFRSMYREMKSFISIEEILCKGCALCTTACPKKIMEIDHDRLNAKGYHVSRCAETDLCIACAMCAIICPEGAITVEKE